MKGGDSPIGHRILRRFRNISSSWVITAVEATRWMPGRPVMVKTVMPSFFSPLGNKMPVKCLTVCRTVRVSASRRKHFLVDSSM